MNKQIQDGPLTETTFLILLAMYEPNHGYGVMQFVEKETNGRVVFGPGTLYGAINNLEKKKWIKPYPTTKDERKKNYIITELGKTQVDYEIKRIKEIYELATATTQKAVKENEKDV